MQTVWITYAWVDNEMGDVDFIAQELRNHKLNVKLDRWNIGAGRRLWDQIARFITDEAESDCWVLYATENSLASERCREEFAYALDRALRSRGNEYPIIGLFPGPVEKSLVPPGIRTRLYVSLTDPDWKERIAAASEGRTPEIETPQIDPFVLRVHDTGRQKVIEIRPRAGLWAPCFGAIPIDEKDGVNPIMMSGPKDRIPMAGMSSIRESVSIDKKLWVLSCGEGANPIQSCYMFCNAMPSAISFGQADKGPNFTVTFQT